jgi:hypothetical protein
MYDPDDAAPEVPMMTGPTTHTTRTDGGEHRTRPRFERPPETTGSEADRHREEIEPGVADLR